MSDRPYSAEDRASLARAALALARDRQIGGHAPEVECCSQPRASHCPHPLVGGSCARDMCMLVHHGFENAPLRPRSVGRAVEEALRPIYTEDVASPEEPCGCAPGPPTPPPEDVCAVPGCAHPKPNHTDGGCTACEASEGYWFEHPFKLREEPCGCAPGPPSPPAEVIEARQRYSDIIGRGQHSKRCMYDADVPCTCYVAEGLEIIVHAARLHPDTMLYDVDGQQAALRRARED